MANVQLNSGTGGAFVATNSVTRDAVTEQMELINVADPTSATCATVDANGLHVNVNGALPAGANNIGSVNVANTPSVQISGTPAVTVSNDVQVSEDGCSYLTITDATAHSIAASLLVGFQELSGTNQAPSITAYDGSVDTDPVMTSPEILGAGQIITYPRGGIKSTTGTITVQCSAAPAGKGIQVLYHT